MKFKYDIGKYLLDALKLANESNYIEIIKISEEMYKMTKSNVSLEITLDAIANIFAIEDSPEEVIINRLSMNSKFLKYISKIEDYNFGTHLKLKNEIDEERVRNFTNNLKNYKKLGIYSRR